MSSDIRQHGTGFLATEGLLQIRVECGFRRDFGLSAVALGDLEQLAGLSRQLCTHWQGGHEPFDAKFIVITGI